MKRALSKVNFTFAINGDVIILTPTDPGYVIEKCNLDVTVKDVYDLHGNKQLSPETWNIYVNLNEMIWVEERVNLKKKRYAPLTFTTKIENLGGQEQQYVIKGLPAWLSVDAGQGSLEPLSTADLTFTVNEGINLGDYYVDLLLSTDFGFDEKIQLHLYVFEQEPEWSVNPSDFQYSMSLVGKVFIDEVVSTDLNDKIGVFVNGQPRGEAYLEYNVAYDQYYVFTNIYSNVSTGEKLEFRIWDASSANVYTDVTPLDMTFVENGVFGSLSKPVDIKAENYIYQSIDLAAGWNWLSFNLEAKALQDFDLLFDQVNGYNFVKSQSGFEEKESATVDYAGNILSNGGINRHNMYKVKVDVEVTITYKGKLVSPLLDTIFIASGWNWLSYLPNINMDVNSAMSSFDAHQDDVLKSVTDFAIYDSIIGWVGSLDFMAPTNGYMLRSSGTGSLIYPEQGLLNKRMSRLSSSYASTYEHSSTMVALIADASVKQGSRLIAKVNNEVRGEAIGVLMNDEVVFFISIQADQDETILFEAVVESEKYKIQESIQFLPNVTHGKLRSPKEMHLGAPVLTDPAVLVQPNPFTNSTTLSVVLKKESMVSVHITDLLGNEVITLKQRTMEKGSHALLINAENLSSGMYLMRVNIGNKTKMLRLIKN